MNEGRRKKLDADGAESSPWEMSKKNRTMSNVSAGPKAQRQPSKKDTFMAQVSLPPTSPLVAELAEKQQQRRGRRYRY